MSPGLFINPLLSAIHDQAGVSRAFDLVLVHLQCVLNFRCVIQIALLLVKCYSLMDSELQALLEALAVYLVTLRTH